MGTASMIFPIYQQVRKRVSARFFTAIKPCCNKTETGRKRGPAGLVPLFGGLQTDARQRND